MQHGGTSSLPDATHIGPRPFAGLRAGYSILFALAVLSVNVGCEQSSSERTGPVKISKAVSGTLRVTSRQQLYRRDEPGSAYRLVRTRLQQIMALKVDGQDEQRHESVVAELPDASRGEFDRRQLQRTSDDRVVLVHETRWMVHGVPVHRTLRGEVAFVAGDWQSFRRGGDVAVRYTEDGLSAAGAAMERHFEKQVRDALLKMLRPAALASLRQQRPELESGQVDVALSVHVDMDRLSNDPIRLRGDELVIEQQSPTELKFRAELTVTARPTR